MGDGSFGVLALFCVKRKAKHKEGFQSAKGLNRSCNRKHDQCISPLAVREVYEGEEEGREES